MNKAWLLLALPMFVLTAGCGTSTDPKDVSSTPVTANPTPTPAEPTVPSTQSPQELAAQADVPVYPGASFPDKLTQAPKKDEAGKMHTYLVMSTPDAPSKVVAFFQKTGKYSEMKTKDGSEIQGMSPKGNLVLIDITEHAGVTNISVKSVQGS